MFEAALTHKSDNRRNITKTEKEGKNQHRYYIKADFQVSRLRA